MPRLNSPRTPCPGTPAHSEIYQDAVQTFPNVDMALNAWTLMEHGSRCRSIRHCSPPSAQFKMPCLYSASMTTSIVLWKGQHLVLVRELATWRSISLRWLLLLRPPWLSMSLLPSGRLDMLPKMNVKPPALWSSYEARPSRTPFAQSSACLLYTSPSPRDA